MKTSTNGVQVMHYFERCVLTAYPDPGSSDGHPWTVGWGDTGPDVKPGTCISQDEADSRFARRLSREFEPGVMGGIQRTATQGQFDAMVCLAYNIGVHAFSGSTLLRKFNSGDILGAQSQFSVWNRSGGRPMLGLSRRRSAEAALFSGASGKAAIAIGASVK